MKVYTPHQANRALPLVKRIVEDVVRTHRRWRDVIQELQLIAPEAREGRGDTRVQTLEREAAGLAQEMAGFERELEALGVALKDRQMGLVDFLGEDEGRPIWLCWRLGEPAVQYWHDLDAGFAGRRPLPSESAT